jgi:hypothetical protein
MKRSLSAGGVLLAAVLLSMLSVGTLDAQLNRASITGTVVDSSGGVVADVNVTATNLGTREVTRGRTNGTGIYSILNLFPGKYSLHFSRAGFTPIDVAEITLQSTQVAKFDETLAVGTVTQAVDVTAQAPILESQTASIGGNINGQVMTDMPLSIGGGRNFEQFAVALTPGYSPSSNPYTAVINGNQVFTKDYTVDGTSGTAQIQGDSDETAPSMEAIQEVQVQTSGIESQNGITNGGLIMLNLKSGTNQFHGSGFDYGHNEILDARIWGDPDKPKNRFWDYGGSIGGPVRKNKTFFFGAFERYQQNDFALGTLGAGTGAATVPTSDFLSGNFSALLNTSKVLGTDTHGNPIYAGAIFNPSDPGAVFVGNVIPQNMISPVSQKIIAIYQKDYAPQSDSLIGNERFTTTNSPSQTPDQVVVKLDHNLTDKNHLSGSWIYNHRPRLLDDSGGVWQLGSTDGGPLAADRDQMVISHQFRVSDSLTITPNLLNIFNATYNRYWNGSIPPETGTNWNSQLGFGSTGADNFPSINFGNAVNGIGETGIGNTWVGHYVAGTFLYADSLSWTKGKHTFMFGGDFRAMQNNSVSGSGALSLAFNPNTTGAPSQPWGNQVGFGFASFLLGDVQSGSEGTPINLYGRRKAMDLFAQDSWKVTPKLTLNIGLRWDATLRLHEKYGHWANFDLNAVDPNLGIPGTVVYASGGSDSFEKNEDWHNLGPNIGIAWNPWRRVVFRGAFNILYVPIGIQYWTGIPYGFAPGFQGVDAATAPFNWGSGYPGVFTPGTKSTTMPINILGATISPNSLLAGYSDNWNIGVQYELRKNMLVDVSYIANRGHHLQDTGLWNNETTPAEFQSLAQSGNALNWVCSAANAAAYKVPYPYPGFCAPALAAVAPYPQLASGEANYWYYPNMFNVGLPIGQSYYDSMVLRFVKRFGAGLTMDLNYTLSRQEGDVYSAFGDSYDTASVQDFTKLGQEAQTLSGYDQKHVFKGGVTYELPFGHGRPLLSAARGVTNGLISGWRVSGLVTYASGLPLSFYSSNYYYYPLWAATYVNYNLSGYNGSQFNSGNFQNVSNSSNPPAADRYFPATVASNPAYGDFGSGPPRVDALRGFGITSENVSLLKNTSFGHEGRYKLQFRVEFYNLFNRHTFANPITDLTSPEFGFVPGVSSTPRNGQFGVRFEF